MRVVLIGAGSAGRDLAVRIYKEKHDVVVVDRDSAVLSHLQEELDIQTVVGHGSSPAVLKRAGIAEADLLVAVTDCDEVNLLACVCAKTAGVSFRVARVSNLDIRADSDLLRLKELGVDLAINPKEECAVELAYMLQLPGAEEVVDLLQGRVLALGFKVSADSPLLRQTLKDCLPQEILRTVRFIAVQRGDDLSIPFGDARFMVGDDLYVVGQPDALPALMDVVYPDRPKIAKAIIAGGGSLGLSLARQLEPSGLDIVLIEMDGRTADACSNVLDRTLVLHGDAMSQETLENAGIGENTAFVSTTGSDENNIIMCLLAQKAGASFTVGSVSKPDYVPIINNLSLMDRAVSPHLSMMNSILHFIRGRNVRAATLFHTLPGELLEIMVETGHAWAGRAVRDLGMPKGTILATMERGGDVLVPTGDTLLGVGDRLVVFALPGAVKKLGHIMNA
jgi:trk system potassium uptake protein TrkA